MSRRPVGFRYVARCRSTSGRRDRRRGDGVLLGDARGRPGCKAVPVDVAVQRRQVLPAHGVLQLVMSPEDWTERHELADAFGDVAARGHSGARWSAPVRRCSWGSARSRGCRPTPGWRPSGRRGACRARAAGWPQEWRGGCMAGIAPAAACPWPARPERGALHRRGPAPGGSGSTMTSAVTGRSSAWSARALPIGLAGSAARRARSRTAGGPRPGRATGRQQGGARSR